MHNAFIFRSKNNLFMQQLGKLYKQMLYFLSSLNVLLIKLFYVTVKKASPTLRSPLYSFHLWNFLERYPPREFLYVTLKHPSQPSAPPTCPFQLWNFFTCQLSKQARHPAQNLPFQSLGFKGNPRNASYLRPNEKPLT